MTAPWIAAFIALWLFVVLLALLVLGTLRRLAPLIEEAGTALSWAAKSGRGGGIPVGREVPSFTVATLEGDVLSDRDLSRTPSILLFIGHSCRACERLVTDLEAGSTPDLGAQLVVATEDSQFARSIPPRPDIAVVADGSRTLARVFENDRTPQAFVIGEDGRVIQSGSPNDWDGLRNLIENAMKGGDERVELTAAAANVSL